MREIYHKALITLIFMVLSGVSYGQIHKTEQIEVDLVSETSTVVPGETFWLGIRLDPIEHWHTYWKFGGDSGVETSISDWQIPEGSVVGDIVWPIPEWTPFLGSELVTFTYEREVFLPLPVTVPADFSGNNFDLSARIDWQVCEEICIPGNATFSLSLPVSNALEIDSRWVTGFAESRSLTPVPENDHSLVANFNAHDDKVNVMIRAQGDEFENVDADSVEWLEKRVDLPQGSQLLRTAQHRLNEKKSIQNLGIGVTGFREVQTLPDLEKAFEEYGSVLLKTVSGGYDGKGQKRIRTEEEIRFAFEALHQEGIPLIAEEYQSFERELSVVVARSRFGEVRCFPVSENLHHQNILTICRIPARLSERVEKEANRIATSLAEGLGLVGVMGVEMFLLSDGDLLVNEIAPRPHNSGHFTLDACETSQFHQHLLAIAGWPLGPTELIKPTLMLNLIGEQQDKLLENLKWLPVGAKLHLYGKKELRPGRKMGHLNLSMENQSQLLETLKQLQVWDGEFLDRMLT